MPLPRAVRRPPAWAWPQLAGLGLIGVLVALVWRERTLYAWDELTFWIRSVLLSRVIRRDAAAAAFEVLRSIRQDEYNLLPSVGPAVVMTAFGIGRAVYVAAIALLYVPPTLLAWTWLVRGRRRDLSAGLLLVACLPLLLSPNLWTPLLLGYPDAGGMALVVLSLGLYVLPVTGGRRLAALAGVGAALAAAALFRRWYVYWAVGFVAAVAADVVVRHRGRGLLAVVRELAVVGGTIGGAGLLVAVPTFWTMLRTMLSTDYATIYSGYREATYGQTLLASLSAVVRRVGLLPLAVSAVAVVVGVIDVRTRRAVAILVTAGGVAFLLFNRANTLGEVVPHHIYLILPALLLPVSLWLAGPGDRVARPRITLVAALCLANYGYALCRPVGEPRLALLSDLPLQSARRADLPQLTDLIEQLGAAVQNTRDRIYVLSASSTFNANHLMAADLSLGRPLAVPSHVGPSHEMDLRDGFPKELLTDRFVVVAFPAQLNLRAADQQVVATPVRDFERGTGVAAAFEAWPRTFDLRDGVTVRVFERKRPSTRAEAEALLEALRAAHPDHPEAFFLPTGLGEQGQ